MVLEEEVESTLGASRHQRVAERSGYRHGRKSRRLTLRAGTVRVGVPRARLVDTEGSEREWQSQLVPRYRRSSPEVEQCVLGVYLSGSNTRRIRRALEPLLSVAVFSTKCCIEADIQYRITPKECEFRSAAIYNRTPLIERKRRTGWRRGLEFELVVAFRRTMAVYWATKCVFRLSAGNRECQTGESGRLHGAGSSVPNQRLVLSLRVYASLLWVGYSAGTDKRTDWMKQRFRADMTVRTPVCQLNNRDTFDWPPRAVFST